MNKVFSIIILVFSSYFAFSQVTEKIDRNWEFYKGDLGSPYEAFRDKELSHLPIWEPVNLPHCFNAFDAVDPDVPYYQGPGWYKNHVAIENPFENGKTLLHFEGAGQKTKVYINETLVAEHVGGYDEFKVDITEAVKNYRKNFPDNSQGIPIAIRCDNSRDVEMIPSDLSDFNLYGGVYRHLNLVYLPAVYLKNTQVDYVLNGKLNKAEVSVKAELISTIDKLNQYNIGVKVTDPSGNVVVDQEQSQDQWSGQQEIFTFSVKKVKLWHPATPNLYKIEVSLSDNKSTYKFEDNMGFRKVEFIKQGPLMVNGERLLLRGTHRHEDHAGYGAAMPDYLVRKEMKMMKDMGVNFIRLGHYQQSELVLDMCDSLGFFVWEEIPWCRGGLGGETYRDQARRMLTNMISQHYNHPSVIVWGLGNENDWPGDFNTFNKDSIRGFMSELHQLAHSLDASRKTAIRRCDFCKDIIDVYSPSIWAGWYRGKYTKYQEVSYSKAMEVDHFLHVEWGASHHAGRHSENPDEGLASISAKGADERAGDFLLTGGDPRVSKDGDWSETYACNLIDWHLKEQENMEWLTGTAYWPFKDFSTPLRPENPVPYVNQKGVVQRDLTPKETYYLFQSYWTEKPMAHIYGHTWETRWGNKDEFKLVKVYSNCPDAELFLNGKSMGTRNRNSQDFPAAGLRWKVKFKEGENHLKVIAHKGKTEVVDEISFNYQLKNWGEAHHLKLEKVAQANDTLTLVAHIYDANGTFIPDAKNQVEFEVAGKAELIDNLGTWDGSRKIQLYNGRALIKIKLEQGKAYASVKAKGVEAAFYEINNK